MTLAAAGPGPSQGPWLRAWRRLRADRAGAAALATLGAIALAAVLVPLLSPHDYATPSWTQLFAPPSWRAGLPLGADGLGRDLLVRAMWGCRISLLVGIAASLVSVSIGLAWGATAGYAGGRTDEWMMRVVDVLYTLPFIPLVIVLEVLLGRNFLLVFVAIGLVSWLDIARIVRSQAVAIRQQEYIAAARSLGLGRRQVIWRHVVPNLAGVAITSATLTVPAVILFESLLAFLGLGVQAPLASLGSLVAEGAGEMQSNPRLLLVPAALLAAIVMSLNLLGDALRDALAPEDTRG
jgi:oligopeptide transport system permease protein